MHAIRFWKWLALGLCASVMAVKTPAAEATPAPTFKPGEVLYQLDLSTLTKLPAGMEVVKEGPNGSLCLRVKVEPSSDVATKGKESAMTAIPIDVSRWKNMSFMITAKVKAEDVAKPAVSYLGIKGQFYWESPSTGKHWTGIEGIFGTFDWKDVMASAGVDSDVDKVYLQLGLQGTSGTVRFTDVRILAWRLKPVRPAPQANAPAPDRGQNLPPRLRGVMSPNQFAMEDFDTLAKWNVNVVRWQMTRRWGQANTDTDLADYDKWMDGKLEDLNKALDAAAARGIKLVIDMHSPPGGRHEDRSMRMFYEKPYADHFVALWEKIARRFKDHPAVWGYDLVNEPVQTKPSPAGLHDYWQLQERAAKAIRAIDPNTPIIVEVDQWDAPAAFAYIEPIKVSKVIYQVHMYQPGGFTHQGVHGAWGEASGKAGVTYPGLIDGQVYDREMLKKVLTPVREFQLAYNVPIFVGEFSAIRWAPGAAQYLEDCTAIFEEYGWDWAYHAFREWPGWSVEHENLPYSRDKHTLAEKPTDRFLALKKWFDQNQKAPIPAAKK